MLPVRLACLVRRLALTSALAVAGGASSAPPAAAQVLGEEVTWSNGVTLSGTLTLPKPPYAPPFRAVVLVSGSGAQNRDSEVAGFRLFALLADHLARHGIAALRYDDRGVGGSTGRLAASTLNDLTGDVAAAVALLVKHPQIDPRRIGVLGHSQGAHVAALATSRSTDVRFVVLAAPPARLGSDVLHRQQRDAALELGATPEQVAAIQAAFAKVVSALRTNAGDAALEAAVREQITAQLDGRSPAARAQLGDAQALVQRLLPGALAQLRAPAMRDLIDFDPLPVFRRIPCPTLALFGGKDVQVPLDEHLRAFEAAFAESGSVKPVVVTYPDANHLFQVATTGRPAEYASLPKAFVPGFLDDLTRWIRALP